MKLYQVIGREKYYGDICCAGFGYAFDCDDAEKRFAELFDPTRYDPETCEVDFDKIYPGSVLWDHPDISLFLK